MPDMLTDAAIVDRHGTAYLQEVRDAEMELRAKYTDAQVEALGKESKAYKNPDGHYSFPIADMEDLKNAIQALGRAPEAVRDAVKAYIKGRAEALKATAELPQSWRALTDEDMERREASWDAEHREGASFKDRHRALSSAIRNQPDAGALSAYLTDFDDDTATYESGGRMFQVPYSEQDDGSLNLGDAQEVQPVTSYEPVASRAAAENQPVGDSEKRTAAWAAKERRKQRAQLVEGMPERRYWQPVWGPVGIEMRQHGDGTVRVGGFASVTEVWYDVGDYEERAVRGSFKRTLGEDPDVMFLANHDGMPLGRTKTRSLFLEEPPKGLRYDVDLQSHDPDVMRLLPKLEREDMDESSFAFRARDQEWDADYRKRSLLDIGLHKGDVSVVNFGANPAASAGLRAFEDLGVEHLGEAVMEARAGKAISSKNEAQIKDAIGKLEALLPQEPEPEAPVADPLAIFIPTGVEGERARRARAIARAA